MANCTIQTLGFFASDKRILASTSFITAMTIGGDNNNAQEEPKEVHNRAKELSVQPLNKCNTFAVFNWYKEGKDLLSSPPIELG